MDVGVFVPIGSHNASGSFLRSLGPAVEERGFASIWVPEHVVLFDDYDSSYPYAEDGQFPMGGDGGLLEPFTALTYLAAVTERVRLGTAICLIPQRNPVYTAKQAADLDVLSGGRVDFGVGIGWLREEFEALNMPFERRGRRADDHLAVMRSLWTEETSSFDGELYSLPPARCYPKPEQAPLPVHVGGESDAAMRRAARAGQGWFTYNRPPAELPGALERLDPILADHGRSRDDDDFALTVCPYLHPIDGEAIERYAEAGVDHLVVMCLAFTADDLGDTLDTLAKDVLEPATALG